MIFQRHLCSSSLILMDQKEVSGLWTVVIRATDTKN